MELKYSPLAAGEIRLLRPVKAKTSTLCYELVHVPLQSRTHYSALSYTWGEKEYTNVIKVGGQNFPVRKNLHDALSQIAESRMVADSHLSSWLRHRYLWVDAVCINQGTDPVAEAEKSHQVRMMRQIYEKATRVLVWLGKAEDETDNKLAFAKMKSLDSQYSATAAKMIPIRPWWWPHRHVRVEDIQQTFTTKAHRLEQAAMATGNNTHRAWRGIDHVWKSDWWTRTWIYQEASVPDRMNTIIWYGITVVPHGKKVLFMSGKERAIWGVLLRSLLVTRRLRVTTAVFADVLSSSVDVTIRLMECRQTLLFTQTEHTFLEVLQLFRHTNCSDPRDKVYAPLCLAPPGDMATMTPDYGNKAAPSVYMQAADLAMESRSGGPLDFLGYAINRRQRA
jgi:hypothetical protein